MNKIIALILLSMASFGLYAQPTTSFRYQAVVQGANGDPLINANVSFMITILKSDVNKERVYAEFHTASTDKFGLVSLSIGQGTPVFNKFDAIKWGMNHHFLKIQMDEHGGTNFKLIGEVQLLSVPYANHAQTAENVDDADADSTNELQELKLTANELSISKGNSVILPTDKDHQTLTLIDNKLTISNGNSVILPADKDHQTLSLNGNELTISQGNTITLPLAAPITTEPVPINFRGKKIYVYPKDNAVSLSYGRLNITGATSDFNGMNNTLAIVLLFGAGNYAAKVCDDLIAFGFDDWYLPSRAELDAVYKQNYLLQEYLPGFYWSSTEIGLDEAYAINFLTGDNQPLMKSELVACRCIRSE